ncbi:MAG: nucleotidyltransferase domain-containing protein [Paludibacteraceae bacterium]|nr:nucleotidyltransferase domain-containing protein [Paludibacteraceae bacterium]
MTQKEALGLVRRYKQVIAPRFNNDVEVRMFGSYAKGNAHPWSDIDVAVIVPKVEDDKWLNTSVSLGMDVDAVSLLIEPVLMEKDEDTMLYREVMRTGVAV